MVKDEIEENISSPPPSTVDTILNQTKITIQHRIKNLYSNWLG